MQGENKRIAKNYILNMLYEVFLLIVPICVTPYIARILGENGTGQYSYAFSINSYFVLFASLGFGYYAQRLIASHQGDGRQQSIDFWEIIFVRIIPCTITFLLYVLTIYYGVYDSKYNYLMLIMIINIIAVIFDISFFFQGNEEFDKIVLRSIIIKSISFLSIFIFVKEENDLWKYTLIQSLSIFLSNIVTWLYMPQYLKKISFRELHPLKHIKPSLVLFIPTIALSVYTTLDKTLIGIITNLDSENGNYEYAEKLVKMVLTIITSLGTVVSPRNAKKFAEGDLKGVEKNIQVSCRFVFLLGVPLMFGIIVVADNLIPWYLGGGYNKATTLLKLLAPLVLVIGLSNVFGRQFLIPSNQDNKFTIAITSGAIINLLLNIPLIYAFASYGAAVASVIAETVVMLIMLINIRKSVNIGQELKVSWHYWLSGVGMFGVCYAIQTLLEPSPYNTIIIVVSGIIVYLGGILLFKDSLVLKLINDLRKRYKNV